MIGTCTEVVSRAYEHQGEVDALLDEVERDILRISGDRVTLSSPTIKELVHRAIHHIEAYHQRQGQLGGLATGFADLDRMTDGLHAGEMVVIAARPSMGKCLASDSEIALADGSVATIAEIYRRQKATLFTLGDDRRFQFTSPSQYIDDGIKPVFSRHDQVGTRHRDDAVASVPDRPRLEKARGTQARRTHRRPPPASRFRPRARPRP